MDELNRYGALVGIGMISALAYDWTLHAHIGIPYALLVSVGDIPDLIQTTIFVSLIYILCYVILGSFIKELFGLVWMFIRLMIFEVLSTFIIEAVKTSYVIFVFIITIILRVIRLTGVNWFSGLLLRWETNIRSDLNNSLTVWNDLIAKCASLITSMINSVNEMISIIATELRDLHLLNFTSGDTVTAVKTRKRAMIFIAFLIIAIAFGMVKGYEIKRQSMISQCQDSNTGTGAATCSKDSRCVEDFFCFWLDRLRSRLGGDAVLIWIESGPTVRGVIVGARNQYVYGLHAPNCTKSQQESSKCNSESESYADNKHYFFVPQGRILQISSIEVDWGSGLVEEMDQEFRSQIHQSRTYDIANVTNTYLNSDDSGVSPNVTLGPIKIDQVTAGPVTAGPVTAGPVTAGPVTAGPVTAGPATARNGQYAPYGSDSLDLDTCDLEEGRFVVRFLKNEPEQVDFQVKKEYFWRDPQDQMRSIELKDFKNEFTGWSRTQIAKEKAIVVVGFASIDGSEQNNLALSERRSENVAMQLADILNSDMGPPVIYHTGKGETARRTFGNGTSKEHREVWILTCPMNASQPFGESVPSVPSGDDLLREE